MRRVPSAERGSIAATVVVFLPALLALFALLVDGGRVIIAREQAISLAEQAARAAAAAVPPAEIDSGALAPNPALATSVAEHVLEIAGHRGDVVVRGATVTVTVLPYPVTTPLLALVGVPSVVVGAEATARAVEG